MKNLVIIPVLMLFAIVLNAQKLQLTQPEADSMMVKYKKCKNTGLVLMPVGSALFLGGAIVYVNAGLSELGDDFATGLGSAISGGYSNQDSKPKDYSGQYTTGAILMVGGAALAALGTWQLIKAKKIHKRVKNANISLLPTSVPTTSGMGKVSLIPQQTVSLTIPIGK